MAEFECNGPITAVVRTVAGRVDIVAEERSNVDVDVRPGAIGEGPRSAAAQTKIEMDGDLLLVETPQARGFVIRRNPPVEIKIRIPLDSRVQISSASADVNCTGRYANADISTASGDVHIDHVAGDLKRNSASGDTQFNRVEGDLASHSASGDIRGGFVGGNMTLRSASGDIGIESVQGSVKAQAASGDIKIGSIIAGTARIHTASGDVELGVAEGTSVWLDLSSVSGDTSSDLAVSDSAPGGGSASLSLHVRTASGDIAVRRAMASAR